MLHVFGDLLGFEDKQRGGVFGKKFLLGNICIFVGGEAEKFFVGEEGDEEALVAVGAGEGAMNIVVVKCGGELTIGGRFAFGIASD